MEIMAKVATNTMKPMVILALSDPGKRRAIPPPTVSQHEGHRHLPACAAHDTHLWAAADLAAYLCIIPDRTGNFATVETIMKRITLLVASVLALVGISSLAHAKPSVAVLGLEVIDNGSVDKRATQAAQALANELRSEASRSSGKYSLAPNSAKDLLELKLLSDCSDENRDCMSEIGKELKADRLLYGKLERRKGRYLISLKLLNTKNRAMEKTTSELIPVEDLHGSKISRWSRSLYSRLLGVPDSGTLRIDANVDKATIYVDGKVATTLRDGSAKVAGLDEGVHAVAIEAEGYEPYEADVEIIAGNTESLPVSLRKTSSGGGGEGGDSRDLWKYSFYAGVILTAGSGAAWAYNGKRAGYIGSSSLIDDKERAWDELKNVTSMQESPLSIADIIGQNSTGETVDNACGKAGNITNRGDRENPSYQAFTSACDKGETAANNSQILAFTTGAFAIVTGYLAYRAFGGSSERDRRTSKAKKEKSSSLVILPQVTLESIGAGLSLDF